MSFKNDFFPLEPLDKSLAWPAPWFWPVILWVRNSARAAAGECHPRITVRHPIMWAEAKVHPLQIGSPCPKLMHSLKEGNVVLERWYNKCPPEVILNFMLLRCMFFHISTSLRRMNPSKSWCLMKESRDHSVLAFAYAAAAMAPILVTSLNCNS